MSALFRPSTTASPRGKVAEGETRLIFREFAESLNLIEDYDQVALNFLGTVKESVPVDRLAFFVYDNDLAQFRLSACLGLDDALLRHVAFSPHDRLAKWLKINKTFLDVRAQPGVFDYLEDREKDVFRAFGFELCYPLLSMNRLIGILCVRAEEGRRRGSPKHELGLHRVPDPPGRHRPGKRPPLQGAAGALPPDDRGPTGWRRSASSPPAPPTRSGTP